MAILFYTVLRWKKRVTARIGDPPLVQQLTSNYSPRKFTVKFVLLLLALALIILGLANLQRKTQSTVSRNGLDIMILLDVSNSMLAADLQPSRLARAKQVISRLLDDMPDDRVGMIIFAGHAYLQMPLSTDHAAAKMYLDAAGPQAVPTQGTNIGEALQMAQQMFSNKEKKYKAVVLITDGEDHDESAPKIAGQLHDMGVVVHTIGLGSPTGAFIIDPTTGEQKKDAEGNVVVSKLNQPLLQDIASKTEGTYQLYENTDAVASNLEKSLSEMGSQSYEDDNYAQYQSYFFWFLLGGLILVLAEWCIPERRRAVLTLAGVVLLSLGTSAQKANNLIRKGNDAYNKQQFDQAATDYQNALAKEPSSDVGQYNLGNALYKGKKLDEAASAYDKASKASVDKAFQQKAYYNEGVALQQQQKLPEAIEAYKKALKLNPSDQDARFNLQKALEQQRQQQQQQQQKQPPPPPKNKQKQQNQKQQQQPPPQPQNKLNRQQAEQLLNAMEQREKELHDKMEKAHSTPQQPDKDW